MEEKAPGTLIETFEVLMEGLLKKEIEQIVQWVKTHEGIIFPSDIGKVNTKTEAKKLRGQSESWQKGPSSYQCRRCCDSRGGKLKAFKDEMTSIFLSLYNVKFGDRKDDSSAQTTVTEKSKGGSLLANTYDTATGTIKANNNVQKQYGLRDPMKWSDVVFETYNRLKATQAQQGLTTQHISEAQRLILRNVQTIDTLAYTIIIKVA